MLTGYVFRMTQWLWINSHLADDQESRYYLPDDDQI